MRCLTLANELARRGARTHFACANPTPALASRIRALGHCLSLLPETEEAQALRPGEEMAPWTAARQTADAQRTRESVVGASFDCVVVDHYRLDERWERDSRHWARYRVVIDDLANRKHDCELLLDQTLGRDPRAYSGLVPLRCVVRAGSDYALLRPEFARVRTAALARRGGNTGVERLLISLGGTDVGGVTAAVLRAVAIAAAHCTLDVVIAPDAPSHAPVLRMARESSNVVAHVDPRNMASLMAAADLSIGAAGTTSWERCCVGLPSVVLVLAENQRYLAQNLVREEVAVLARDVADLGPELTRLLADVETRSRLARRSAALVDGLGTTRFADDIEGLVS